MSVHRDSVPKTLRVPPNLYELFRDKCAQEGHDQTWVLLRMIWLYVSGEITEDQLRRINMGVGTSRDIQGRR